jgi:hypothetical protein
MRFRNPADGRHYCIWDLRHHVEWRTALSYREGVRPIFDQAAVGSLEESQSQNSL